MVKNLLLRSACAAVLLVSIAGGLFASPESERDRKARVALALANANGKPLIAVAPAPKVKLPNYPDAYRKAMSGPQPLVMFVGVDLQPVKNAVVARADVFADVTAPAIVIGYPVGDRLWIHATLPGDATPKDVQKAADDAGKKIDAPPAKAMPAPVPLDWQIKAEPGVSGASGKGGACACGPSCECAGFCIGIGSPVKPLTVKIADPRDACVRVSWKQWGASGTCIASEGGKSLVLTCNHLFYEQPHDGAPFLLGDYPLASVVSVGGKRYEATAVAGDADADLALVVVDGTLPVAELASACPAVGTKVRHYGLGSGGGTGKVLPYPENASRPSMMFLYDARSESGDSGAGVFDDDGRLVAVHCGRDGMAASAPARGTPVSTVRVVVKQGSPRLFPRIRALLGARSQPVELPAAVPPATTKPAPDSTAAAPARPSTTTYYYPTQPFAGGCANGQCPAPTQYRRGLFGR